MPLEMNRQHWIQSNEATLWTISEGRGIPILLCNGGWGCCDYLAPVAEMLTDVAQVIRWEQRGCGRSSTQLTYTLEECLSDMEAIRHAYGIDRWIVAGHSAGADAALLYALHYPAHTVSIICLAGGRIHNDREWHKVYDEKQKAGLEPPLDWAYPPNLEVNRQLNQAWKRYIQRPTLLYEIANMTRPALFLYGDQDIRPSWPIEQVANLLPNARFEMLQGADHYLWQQGAEIMKRLMQEFVRKGVQYDA